MSDATDVPSDTRTEGYDPRVGASHYSNILAALAGFVVTGLVVLFTVPEQDLEGTEMRAYAAGLLVLGLVGCVFGAFGMAAVAAERTLTPNVPAVVMCVGAAVVIGVQAIFVAFYCLSVVYLSDAQLPMYVACCGCGFMTMLFSASTVSDAHFALDQGDQSLSTEWLRSYRGTRVATYQLMIASAVIVSIGIGANLLWRPTSADPIWTKVTVSVGLIVAFGLTAAGLIRTVKPLDSDHVGLRRIEASVIQLGTATFVCLLLSGLPWG